MKKIEHQAAKVIARHASSNVFTMAAMSSGASGCFPWSLFFGGAGFGDASCSFNGLRSCLCASGFALALSACVVEALALGFAFAEALQRAFFASSGCSSVALGWLNSHKWRSIYLYIKSCLWYLTCWIHMNNPCWINWPKSPEGCRHHHQALR